MIIDHYMNDHGKVNLLVFATDAGVPFRVMAIPEDYLEYDGLDIRNVMELLEGRGVRMVTSRENGHKLMEAYADIGFMDVVNLDDLG